MSDYQRFITYLYQHGVHTSEKAVGFAKIEKRQGRLRIQIQIQKCLDMDGEFPVYLCYGDEKIKAILIDQLVIKDGMGEKTILLSSQMDFVSGIRIGDGDNYLGSVWEDQKTIEAAAIPVEEIVEKKKYDFAEQESSLIIIKGVTYRCYRILLREIKYLPTNLWYLGNNQFLLHGFFQYGYLVFGKQENGKSIILGVPGRPGNQERVAGAICGFPEFHSYEKTGALSGASGFWFMTQE